MHVKVDPGGKSLPPQGIDVSQFPTLTCINSAVMILVGKHTAPNLQTPFPGANLMTNGTVSNGSGEKLRPAQLAQRWNVSARYIQKLMGLGLPYFKLGHAVLFDPVEVEAWLRQHHQQQTKPKKKK
jgi:hypothetical protein